MPTTSAASAVALSNRPQHRVGVTPMNVETAYRLYFPLIHAHCRRLVGTGDWAEDIAQESFLRLMRTSQLPDERSTVAWLYRTSSNLVVDRVRHFSRRGTNVEVDELKQQPPGESLTLRSLLRRLAQMLDVQTMQAGLLSRADGLTHHELAQVLEISERTARRRLVEFEAAVQTLKTEEADQ